MPSYSTPKTNLPFICKVWTLFTEFVEQTWSIDHFLFWAWSLQNHAFSTHFCLIRWEKEVKKKQLLHLQLQRKKPHIIQIQKEGMHVMKSCHRKANKHFKSTAWTNTLFLSHHMSPENLLLTYICLFLFFIQIEKPLMTHSTRKANGAQLSRWQEETSEFRWLETNSAKSYLSVL